MRKNDERVPEEFCCAGTGKPLYLPVVTNGGIVYSCAALHEMFRRSAGVPRCKVTKESMYHFPAVCIALHQYLWVKYRGTMRSRQKEDEAVLDSLGLAVPDIATVQDDFGRAFQCKVSRELAYEPCVLYSGTIISKYTIPTNGFVKDPDRLCACALHGQIPEKCDVLEMAIRDMLPQEYSQRAKEAPLAKATRCVPLLRDPQTYVHIGMGCDGCGMLPIFGTAWYDSACLERVGFHLCDACYRLGFHRRVLTGRFGQDHLPTNTMVQVETTECGLV